MTEYLNELFMVKVIASWEASNETQLSIVKGSILSVLKVTDAGWWFVEDAERDATGWAPSNFMKKLSGDTESVEPFPDLPLAQEGEGCNACKKVLPVEFVVFQENKYHRECYVCGVCKGPLSSSSLVCNDGRLFCAEDYRKEFNPKCAHCKDIIDGPYKEALGHTWHPEHVICSVCEIPFTDGKFFHQEGGSVLYCQEHFYEKFLARCAECDGYVSGKCYKVAGNSFHVDCFFCCHEGGKHLIKDGETYHERDGSVYCTEHFKTLVLDTCKGCQKYIEKDYINFHNLKYHSTCFNCQLCDNSLRKQYFGFFNQKITCSECMRVPSEGEGEAGASPTQTKNKQRSKKLETHVSGNASGPVEGWYKPVSGNNIERLESSGDHKIEFEFVPGSMLPTKSLKDVFMKAPTKKVLKSCRRSNDAMTANVVLSDTSSLGSISEEEADIDLSDDEYPEWDYNDLKGKDTRLPDGVDVKVKEKYLSSSQFKLLFGVSRQVFDKYPLWKRKSIKQKLDLF